VGASVVVGIAVCGTGTVGRGSVVDGAGVDLTVLVVSAPSVLTEVTPVSAVLTAGECWRSACGSDTRASLDRSEI